MRRGAAFATLVAACGAPATPTQVNDEPAAITAASITALDDGYAVSWLVRMQDGTDDQIWFATLAPDGSRRGEPRVLVADAGAAKNAVIVRVEDQLILSWIDGDIKPHGDVWARRIHVAAFDLGGQLLRGPAIVSTMPYYYRDNLTLATSTTAGCIGFIAGSATPALQSFTPDLAAATSASLSGESACGICTAGGDAFLLLTDDGSSIFEVPYTEGASPVATPIAPGRCPSCTTGPSGELVAAWLTPDAEGGLTRVAVRDATWQILDPQIAPNRAESQDRAVARSASTVLVAWQGDHEHALGQIYIRRLDASVGTLGEIEHVSDPLVRSREPALAARMSEAMLVFIAEAPEGELVVARPLAW